MEAPSICPYSHSSLGKVVLDYCHDSSKSAKKFNFKTSSSHDLTLSIPESELTWKGGSRTQGTQMLIFRASQSVSVKPGATKKKPPHLLSSSTSLGSNSSSASASVKKTARKTVALELQRINPANLAKFQSQTVAPSTTLAQSHDQTIGGSRPVAAVDLQNGRRCGSAESAENVAVVSQKVNGCGSSSVSNAARSKSLSKQNRSDNSHKQQVNTSLDDDVVMDSDHNLGAARTQALHRKKPDTKEIGVMTDLCGIDSVLDLSPVSSKMTNISTANDRKSSGNLHLSLGPRPSTKKGFTDRCTSPGFPSKLQPFKNGGGVNGLTFNGYASPEVLMLRAGPGAYQRKKKKALSLLHRCKDKHLNCLVSSERNGQHRDVLTHKDPETGEIRQFCELQGGAAAMCSGGGKRGDVPFTISIPRMILSPNSQQQSDAENMEDLDAGNDATGENCERLSCDDNARKGQKADSLPTQQKNVTSSSSTYKRRSEIQLLLDGDKPPSERISASEVPIFTAEDLSSRNNRTTGGGGAVGGATSSGSGGGGGGSGAVVNKSWLDSSTRKITPVAHFDHSYFSFPHKFTGIVSSSSSNSSSNNTGGVNSAAHSRKRSVSDSDNPIPTARSPGPVAAPPPPKQQKVNNRSGTVSSSVLEESESCPQGGDPLLSENSNGDALPTPALEAAHSVNSNTPLQVASDKPEIGDDCGSLDIESLSKFGCTNSDPLFQPEDVFASELVVFDSRGDCLLQEGEYSIMMQRCSKKEGVAETNKVLTFPPLTWSSVFGGHTETRVSG